MTLDTPQQHRFGPVMNFDYPPHGQQPAFSNPWSSSPSASHTAAVAGSNLYVGGLPPPLTHSLLAKPHSARAPTSSAPPLPSYASMPVGTTSAGMFLFLYAHRSLQLLTERFLRSARLEPPTDFLCCVCRRHLRHDSLSRPRPLCASFSYLRCYGLCTSSCAADRL